MVAAPVTQKVAARLRLIRWLHELGKRRSADWVLALLIGCLALAIALYRLGAPSLWMDETLSVEHARQPFDILWASFTSGYSAYMFLYFLLLDGWLHLTGWIGLAPSEFVIRFPSAVFGALTAVMVFLIGRRFANRWVGVAAALLCLLNPWQLTYSQDARSYSMLLFFSAVSWCFLLAALDDIGHARRYWIWYVVAATLATYAQILNVFVIFAQMVLFACLVVLPTAWRQRVRTKWLPMAVSLVIIGVLVAPLAYVGRNGAWHTQWVPVLSISDVLQRISRKFLGSSTHAALAVGLVALVGIGLVVAYVRLGGIGRFRRGVVGPGEQTLRQRLSAIGLGTLAFLCWFIVPLVTSWVLTQQGTAHVFSGRYLIYIEPAVCLLFGVALIALRSRMARALVLLALVAATTLTLPQYYAHAQIEDWRSATRWLEQRYQTGDGLVSYNNVQGCEVAVEAYLHSDHSQAHFTSDSPGVMSWAGIRTGNPFPNFGDALNVQMLSRFAAHHPRIFFIAGRLSGDADTARVQTVVQWLQAHYHLIGQTNVQGVTIYLFETGGA